jgi:hypothetical protein
MKEEPASIWPALIERKRSGFSNKIIPTYWQPPGLHMNRIYKWIQNDLSILLQ